MPRMNDTSIQGESNELAPHDVLAAEEFAFPAPDPSIAHPPVVLPDDPSGIAEPHDVLAAEEFALPATPPHPGGPVTGPSRRAWWRGVLAAAVLLALGAKLRRRRAR
jgi:hypothetical protein